MRDVLNACVFLSSQGPVIDEMDSLNGQMLHLHTTEVQGVEPAEDQVNHDEYSKRKFLSIMHFVLPSSFQNCQACIVAVTCS